MDNLHDLYRFLRCDCNIKRPVLAFVTNWQSVRYENVPNIKLPVMLTSNLLCCLCVWRTRQPVKFGVFTSNALLWYDAGVKMSCHTLWTSFRKKMLKTALSVKMFHYDLMLLSTFPAMLCACNTTESVTQAAFPRKGFPMLTCWHESRVLQRSWDREFHQGGGTSWLAAVSRESVVQDQSGSDEFVLQHLEQAYPVFRGQHQDVLQQLLHIGHSETVRRHGLE